MDNQQWMEVARMIVNCEQKQNYPLVSISDCVLDRIIVTDKSVTISFNDFGVWLKKQQTESYQRVKSATMHLYEVKPDTIELYEIQQRNILVKRYAIKKNIQIDKLVDKINASEWLIEIVHEYYSSFGGDICWSIEKGRKKSDVFIRVDFGRREFHIES